MKEHEQIHEAPGSRVLKSLLKKPGQGNRQRKNRVVINEKLNEFFAADYIILIKEECCGDYEEECDCCCQEPEMIRLGNCKECRAEMARHLAGEDPRNGQIDVIGRNNEESQCEDDDEDEEEEYEEEVDDDDDEAESSEEAERITSTPPSQQEPQQQETLSPPEGYKDVCDEETSPGVTEEVADDLGQVVVCGECNYYRQRASDGEECIVKASAPEASSRGTQEEAPPDASAEQTCDQSQQSTSDIHQQRYVVETITMTTVTERRIVREISEEKPSGLDQTDARPPAADQNNSSEAARDPAAHLELTVGEEDKAKRQTDVDNDPSDPSDVSMTFKLGNVSLVSNSCKPNSAVRQLFPNQRLISQPPALTKVSNVLSTDEATDSDGSERYLVTTESLRLFDSVKRAKMAGSRSDSSESDSSTIRRTIERNALRRSLVCKFDGSTSKKKNLMNKDLTLEERIRQLTCVDQDEDTTGDSTSESAGASEGTGMLESKQELPVRTSPSGEERPLRNERVVRPLINSQEHSSPSPPLHHHHHHHHYHHHHHQSTYKKITDLFGPKRIENMPDLGLGDRTTLAKSSSKLTSDARKQFLASLAPLSCVASTGVDSQDYYQLSSKVSNRDSMSYNSDSSYSLEDIDAVLRGDERNSKNSPGPPDVTRGTPTGTGPNDIADTTTDELLAFVEQDKTRTERLKRRYDTDDHQDLVEKINGSLNDDEDDELNDYGFNRRPSVRGIKPQFESTSEIVRQLRYRTLPVSIADSRMVVPPGAWPYYEADSVDNKRVTFIQEPEEINGKTRDNTINRINTMQRQIDDIYQTIAETAVSVQGNIERGSYLESTLPRTVPRATASTAIAECQRYDQKNGAHFQDHTAQRVRMSEVSATSAYNNTLPGKNRRAPVALSNYPCGVMPVENTKCYRTIYLLPNGLADPTYQNIQRILPAHSSPNYATHIERYPYPKNPRPDDHPQPPPRYYPRTPPGHTAGISPSITAPQPLHLHLHQPEEGFAASTIGMQTLQLQHHQHISQLATTYNVQSLPAYTVMAPSRPQQEYHHPYSIHLGRGAADIQTQTNSGITSSAAGFNGSSQQHLVSVATASSATSSVLSSPTKLHGISGSMCSAAERGVPEGAASAPAHDFVSQGNSMAAHSIGNSFVGHSNNVPPPNTQNSVYYAMNV